MERQNDASRLRNGHPSATSTTIRLNGSASHERAEDRRRSCHEIGLIPRAGAINQGIESNTRAAGGRLLAAACNLPGFAWESNAFETHSQCNDHARHHQQRREPSAAPPPDGHHSIHMPGMYGRGNAASASDHGLLSLSSSFSMGSAGDEGVRRPYHRRGHSFCSPSVTAAPGAETMGAHVPADVVRKAVAAAAAVAAAVANSGVGEDSTSPNPADLLSMLTSAMKSGSATDTRAFNEMVAASVGAGFAAGRGARRASLAAAGAVPITSAMSPFATSSSSSTAGIQGTQVSRSPPRLHHSGSTNRLSLSDESAPASPLKRIKSSHFPMGAPRSFAIASAANALNNRGSAGRAGGSQGGPGKADGAGGMQFGGRGPAFGGGEPSKAPCGKSSAQPSKKNRTYQRATNFGQLEKQERQLQREQQEKQLQLEQAARQQELRHRLQQHIEQKQHQQEREEKQRRQRKVQLQQQQQQQQFSDEDGQGAAADDRPVRCHRGAEDLRRNCDFCVKKKVKCSGTMPCAMCSRKGLRCEFSLKQKPGPKVRPLEGPKPDERVPDAQPALPSQDTLGNRDHDVHHRGRPSAPAMEILQRHRHEHQQHPADRQGEQQQQQQESRQREIHPNFAHSDQQPEQPRDGFRPRPVEAPPVGKDQGPRPQATKNVGPLRSFPLDPTSTSIDVSGGGEVNVNGGHNSRCPSIMLLPPPPFPANVDGDGFRPIAPAPQHHPIRQDQHRDHGYHRAASENDLCAGYSYAGPTSPVFSMYGSSRAVAPITPVSHHHPRHDRGSSMSSELNRPFDNLRIGADACEVDVGREGENSGRDIFGTLIENASKCAGEDGKASESGPRDERWGSPFTGKSVHDPRPDQLPQEEEHEVGDEQRPVVQKRQRQEQEQQQQQQQQQQQRQQPQPKQQPKKGASDQNNLLPEVDQSAQALLAMRRGFHAG